MASPPTIGTPSNPGTLSGTYYSANSYTSLYTFLRASWAQRPGGFPDNLFYQPTAVHANASGTISGGSFPMLRFWSDAPDLEIVNKGGAGGYYLYVDGELAQAELISHAAGSGEMSTRFTWLGRQIRLYEIEGVGNFIFGGVKVPNTSKVWPAPLTDLDLRIILHGDSFVERSMSRYLPQLLGHADTRGSGLGATGFVADYNGAKYKFIQRAQTDVIDAAPHVIIEAGGRNDNASISGDAANMETAVNTWLDTVQAALPDALIFMTGGMASGDASNAGNFALVRDGKHAACAGRNNVFFLDNVAGLWVSGTGKVGATANNGNADWITDTDGTHPTDVLGGQYLAHRIAQAMLTIIEAELT